MPSRQKLEPTGAVDDSQAVERFDDYPRKTGTAWSESGNRSEAFFDFTAVGAAVLSPDARFVEVNDAFCRLTGYSRAELTAMDFLALTHEKDARETQARIAGLFAGDVESFVAVERYVRKDGAIIQVQNSVSLTRDVDGRPLSLIALCEDITDRERAKHLLIEQGRLLELIAKGRSLDEILAEVTAVVPRLQPATRACILVADEEQSRFSGAYPADDPSSFAPALGDAVKDIPLDRLAVGTCGDAVFRNEPITCGDIAHDERWSEPWRKLCVANGVLGCHSEPAPGSNGAAVASLMLCFDSPREPSVWEQEIARFGAHVAGLAIARDRAESALQKSEARLTAELADAEQLQAVSAQLLQEDDVESLYRQLLDAVVTVMRSDFGSMQIFYPERNQLKLLTDRDFSPEAVAFWEWVEPATGSTCGYALMTGKRSIVADVEACDFMAGTEDLKVYRHLGVKAVQSTPLVSRNGRTLGMISTHWREPHEPSVRDLRLLDVLARQAADLIDRSQTAETLRESEERYRHIVENAKEYAIITLDGDGCIVSWNNGAERMLGYSEEEAVGRSGAIFFTPQDRARDEPNREMSIARAEGRAGNERWHQRKDGSRFWGSGVMLPTPIGHESRYLKIIRDRTEERQAEERQKLLNDELNHRVKNTLAIVQGLAHQSFRGNVSEEARNAFSGRLEALAGAHDLLTRRSWESADLSEVVRNSLDACNGRSGRFDVDGLPVHLEPRTAVTVTLALHELCTNAAKYGALSTPSGRISIKWTLVDAPEPRLRICWEEMGGPPVAPPQGRGFGLRMIERALASELQGTVRLDFRPAGLVCVIDAPLPTLAHREPDPTA